MSLDSELQKTIQLIINAQEKSLLRKIERENNWTLKCHKIKKNQEDEEDLGKTKRVINLPYHPKEKKVEREKTTIEVGKQLTVSKKKLLVVKGKFSLNSS